MPDNLNVFYRDFLNAPQTLEVRTNGVPLEILDKLTSDEKVIAEKELINVIEKEPWAIKGLAKLKSEKALDRLYSLLTKEELGLKIEAAHAIYLICQDEKMVDIFLEEIPKQIYWVVLAEMLSRLSDFRDDRIIDLLKNYCGHKDFLVSHNAKKALQTIKDKNTKPNSSLPKAGRKWWRKLFISE